VAVEPRFWTPNGTWLQLSKVVSWAYIFARRYYYEWIDKTGEANISGVSVRLNYVKRFEMSKKFKSFLTKLPL
tara:strand:+ start:215 stop:433 length:219 start_codon:yes stop_codon:yes gene_type:complete